MSFKQFTQKENIVMLWDVIIDEEIFRFLAPDIQQKIHQLFISNIKGFFESEKLKTNSLVDLNKKYILLILNHIKTTYPYQPNKIKIHNDYPVKETITYEDIQNDRRSQFEKDLTKRQNDFENSMAIKAPPVPEFADKHTDSPIKEMGKILKEMQAQRNYEVEQINRKYSASNNIDNWLKPQETSLKNEKIGIAEEQIVNQDKPNSRFKFLNNLETNPSPINNKKTVSFSDNNEINSFNEDDEDDNVFTKLKKIDKNIENIKFEVNEVDRILQLERKYDILDEKINKILDLLNKQP